jgi:hypothetical protein
MIAAGPSGRTVWSVGLDRLGVDTVGSNPAQGLDVCHRLFIVIIYLSPYYQRYVV